MILARIGSEDTFVLTPEKDTFELGRNQLCDFTFRSKFVSRKHCEISRIPPHGSLLIKNMTTTNNTYVDNIKLDSLKTMAELRIGSRIGLGVPLSFVEKCKEDTNYVFLIVRPKVEPEKLQENLTNELKVSASHIKEENCEIFLDEENSMSHLITSKKNVTLSDRPSLQQSLEHKAELSHQEEKKNSTIISNLSKNVDSNIKREDSYAADPIRGKSKKCEFASKNSNYDLIILSDSDSEVGEVDKKCGISQASHLMEEYPKPVSDLNPSKTSLSNTDVSELNIDSSHLLSLKRKRKYDESEQATKILAMDASKDAPPPKLTDYNEDKSKNDKKKEVTVKPSTLKMLFIKEQLCDLKLCHVPIRKLTPREINEWRKKKKWPVNVDKDLKSLPSDTNTTHSNFEKAQMTSVSEQSIGDRCDAILTNQSDVDYKQLPLVTLHISNIKSAFQIKDEFDVPPLDIDMSQVPLLLVDTSSSNSQCDTSESKNMNIEVPYLPMLSDISVPPEEDANYHSKKTGNNICIKSEPDWSLTTDETISERIKKEPAFNGESNIDIMVYSQMDEVILISSDEENDSMQLSSLEASFGPVACSPELSLDSFDDDVKYHLFANIKKEMDEDGEERKKDPAYDFRSFMANLKSDPCTSKPNHENLSKAEDTEHGSFNNDDDEIFLKHYDVHYEDSKSAPELSATKLDEDIPSPILSEVDPNDLNSYWPQLSQEFEEPSNDQKSDKQSDNLTKDLNLIIKKVAGKFGARKTKTTEFIPPLNRKRLTVKPKQGIISPIHDPENQMNSLVVANNKHPVDSANDITMSKLPSKKKNKNASIRSTIVKKNKLESLGATLAQPKKSHHILTHENNTSKVNTRIDTPMDNISIQSKSTSNSIKKGIAKITKVNRNQKLTEVDLFTASSETLPNKTKYKIPKRTKMEEGPRQIPPTLVPPLIIKIDYRAKSKNVPNIPTTFQRNSNSILKDVNDSSVYNKMKKKVHFPPDSDIVKIKFISPREKSNYVGPNNVHKETYVPQSHNPYQFIHHIGKWNYDWLKTYGETCIKGKPVPPPVGDSQMLPTLTRYKSYNDYKDIFSNLMYYELWEQIYTDWSRNCSLNSWLGCLLDTKSNVPIPNQPSFKFMEVKLISLITEDMDNYAKHPMSGCFVCIRKKTGKYEHIFGYIEKIEKQRNRCIPQDLRQISHCNGDIILIMHIYACRGNSEQFFESSIFSICNVSYIKPALRSYDSLCRLPTLRLCRYILDPINMDVFGPYGYCTDYMVKNLPLNKVQEKAVCEISDKSCHRLHEPKISLLQGPPGTGKTLTVTAIIAQIHKILKSFHSSNRRILVCAPSNAAVDDLTLRLKKLCEIDIFLNVVRFGVRKSISPAVKKYSYEEVLKKEIDRKMLPHQNDSLQKELKYRKQCVDEATTNYQRVYLEDNVSDSTKKRLEHRMVELVRSEKELRDQSKRKLSSEEYRILQEECRKKVLLEAEVITTTLTSCLSGDLNNVFSKKQYSFACCIIDEAGQCKETETWLPLQLGVNKLVLVGDHLQLPATVLSRMAQGKNLHQSLFERLFHCVVFQENRPDLVNILNMQFRMHKEIALWPSERFYKHDLNTDPAVTVARTYGLKPYILFDLQDSHEERLNKGEIYNLGEVSFVHTLLISLEPYLKSKSVGVVTPYQQQKIHLLEKLSGLRSRLDITVSTIDGFQGKEKDVILCSFVRSNSKIGFVADKQRLNVALTRARFSCFVIGNFRSLYCNDDWQSLIDDAVGRKLLFKIRVADSGPQVMEDILKMTRVQQSV